MPTTARTPATRSRTALRLALAAAILTLSACARNPTAPSSAAHGGPRADDNGGILGSGYNTQPDTTVRHP
ncbi:MAG: hypothetical protein JWM27_1138 [Gemmatimonadetes bacterium]|nr:hypothetical protein [Gemmatimonadota bacterium]